MRIRSIHVQGLFGLFDHPIELHRDERITIIHGPNGFGKTIILRMLKSFFDGQYGIFLRVPIRAFTVLLDDDHELRLEVSEDAREAMQRLLGGPGRGRDGDSPHGNALGLHLSAPMLSITSSRHPEPFSLSFGEMLQANGSRIHLPDGRTIRRIGVDTWLDMDTGTRIDSRTLVSRFGAALGMKSREWAERSPAWLRELCDQTHIQLIETQRLDVEDEDPAPSPSSRGLRRRPTVLSYSDELADTMRDLLARYASRSQDLDRTFPARLLEQSTVAPGVSELQDQLADLDKKRRHLTKLGFLDPEENASLPVSRVMEDKRDVLAVYVVDMQKKLAVFDDMAARMELLLDIINGLFLYKHLRIDREAGFVFTSHTGQQIASDHLSAGEQHQLILLYELLFHTKPGSLVLIDEPEISLHVGWQERFLDDLMKIVKVSDFDVLVATHAPEIIGGHWNLVEQLLGPDDREGVQRGAGRP